ncbi:MAG: hypothetical protein B6I20_05055 [Bacteroidetes bacterium 4572_117]|nr:MAG: hypothetical protein B6I20_05055 [Bacteroidetes bacterium 4572_117]
MLDELISDDEFLFRGIIHINWDFNHDRPSSATFKDSFGVSVDRDGGRNDKDCYNSLLSQKDFFAICKVKKKDILDLNGIVKYLPEENNIYHSEIHDSEERIQLRGKKPKRIRDKAIVVYRK